MTLGCCDVRIGVVGNLAGRFAQGEEFWLKGEDASEDAWVNDPFFPFNATKLLRASPTANVGKSSNKRMFPSNPASENPLREHCPFLILYND